MRAEDKTRKRKLLWITLLLVVTGLAGAGYSGKATMAAGLLRTAIHYRTSTSAAPRPGAFPAPSQPAAWKKAVAECAKPGPYVRVFVNSFPGKPPEKMAQIYMFIAQKWQYSADHDRDWLTPAEALLQQPDQISADCKSIAIVLSACARELGVDSQMVATRGNVTHPGHVQTQIELSGPKQDPVPVIARMARIWGTPGAVDSTLPLLRLESGTWLVLDGGLPPRKVENLGAVEAVINNYNNEE